MMRKARELKGLFLNFKDRLKGSLEKLLVHFTLPHLYWLQD